MCCAVVGHSEAVKVECVGVSESTTTEGGTASTRGGISEESLVTWHCGAPETTGARVAAAGDWGLCSKGVVQPSVGDISMVSGRTSWCDDCCDADWRGDGDSERSRVL